MASTNSRSKSKKRRRSFGRVCRRPNGDAYIQFLLPDAPRGKNGRRKVTTRAVSSKREGEQLLREIHLAILRGTFAPTPEVEESAVTDMTVIEAIDTYIGFAEAAGRAEKTLRGYKSIRVVIAKSALATRAVVAVTPAALEKYVAWRRERRWWTVREGDVFRIERRVGATATNATINRDLLLLSAAFNRLKRLGQFSENPAARVPRLKETKKARVALSKEDASLLLAACDPPLRLLVLAGLLTGARAGELTRLNWCDLDFTNKRISLYRPKTRTGTSIPLHSALAAELKRVKKARGKVGDSDTVFLSRNGTRYVSYKRAWTTAVKRAGLGDRKGLVFHSLRHSFATAFLQNGAAITDLKELLGHQSITTTQIYAGMVDRRARASLEALEFGSAFVVVNQ